LVGSEHWVVFGVHTAPHCPAVTLPFCQVPVVVQDCGTTPLQPVWFGAQLPWHVPSMQV
jgi:hypothetical protein